MRAWCTLAVQGFRFLHLRISTIFRLFIVLLANWPFLWLIAMSWVFMNDFIIKISRSLSRSLADCVIKLGFFHSWSFPKNKKANCIKNKKPRLCALCSSASDLICNFKLNALFLFYSIFIHSTFSFFSPLSVVEKMQAQQRISNKQIETKKKKQKQRNN